MLNDLTGVRSARILSIGAALWLLSTLTGCNNEDVDLTGGGVNGSVHTLGQANTGDDVNVLTETVFLPDLEVTLRNVSTNTESAPVTTDLFGRYYFPRQPAGTYQLQWKAQNGWAEGKHPQEIVITGETRHPTSAQVESDKQMLMVFGKVKQADGGPPFFSAEFFTTEQTATVTIMNETRTATFGTPSRVNASGFYAIAGIPRGEDASIRVQSQASTSTSALSAASMESGSGIDIELPNHRPQIETVVTSAGGLSIRTATGGSTIQLSAITNDADGDALQFEWKTSVGSGTLSGSGATADWILPIERGRYTAYLLVKDGRGGYATEGIGFDVDKKEDSFSGRAVDKTSHTPVKDALVTVGGKNATTDANGFFSVKAPLSDRYVLNIYKAGYALCSRIAYSGLTGQTWPMVKAQEQAVDPKQEIVLVDHRPELDKQKRKGARIIVPANALVDKDGNKPAGALTGYIATLNIRNSETPGDWGAVNAGGKETNLISYGATWVEFLDAAGNKFNLAPGMEARVDQPAPDAMLPAAPTSAKLWGYDESDGYWKISGQANLVGGGFSGKVSHFSAINTDIEKDEPACLKILIYPGIAIGSKIRITDPTGAAFTQSYDIVMDAGLNAVYRLPPNTDVLLELFDPEGNPITDAVFEEELGVPLLDDIVNTGDPIPAGDDYEVPLPYETCHLVVVLPAVEVTPSVFLTFKGTGSLAIANGYYATVDPNISRLTLGEWWDVNGFTFPGGDKTQPPDNAVRTSYLNNNDLGSGRDMYFLSRADGTAAAYVTNYGLFNQDHGNADLAANRDTPRASVCMEFSPVEDDPSGTPIVKFFVFLGNGGGAAAERAPSADLDTFGEKFVPNLCNTCHGGDYFPLAGEEAAPPFDLVKYMNSSFRELDYATYKFPGGALVPDAAEKADFKDQNLIVGAAGNISGQPIKDLITGWYDAGGTEQDNGWAPTGWVGTAGEPLYHSVVAPSCRTCHIALREDISWSTYQQLKDERGFGDTVLDYVLCEDRFMPHAVITYRNFWLSALPHRPEELRVFQDGSDWPALGTCPSP